MADKRNIPGPAIIDAETSRRRKASAVRPPFVSAAATAAASVPDVPLPVPVPVVLDTPLEITKPVPSLAVTIEPKPAEPATLPATLEGNEIMATIAQPTQAAQQATDKAQAMIGDMNTRFKSAFEKSTKMGEELAEFTKGNVEALVASARVAAKGGETIGQEAADYSKKSFESAIAMFKSFASVKSPTELFQLQSDYAKSSFDSAVAEASKLSEAMLKIAGEVAQPLSSRYALAAEKVKSTAL